MMGDDMVIRSGGMYGEYTSATPSNRGLFSSGGFAIPVSKIFKGISAGVKWGYAQDQLSNDLRALKKEREYNVKNFQQMMADTLAKNKMSFYASGLEHGYGTAFDVTESNQRALKDEFNMMIYNYQMREKNIHNAEKAANRQLVGDIISSVF
jgi:flagellar biosynthesis/type III secretory pathway protein FliH